MFKQILKVWLPTAFIFTVLCGMVYLVMQQSLRLSANDPQIALAEDAAQSLVGGDKLLSSLTKPVAIDTNLAPYRIQYDTNGKPIVGEGYLHGALPTLPAGVFAFAKEHGEDRITWQPAAGVRQAIVVVSYGGSSPGFVMVGRSLKTVEERIATITTLIEFGWIATLFATFLISFFIVRGQKIASVNTLAL